MSTRAVVWSMVRHMPSAWGTNVWMFLQQTNCCEYRLPLVQYIWHVACYRLSPNARKRMDMEHTYVYICEHMCVCVCKVGCKKSPLLKPRGASKLHKPHHGNGIAWRKDAVLCTRAPRMLITRGTVPVNLLSHSAKCLRTVSWPSSTGMVPGPTR